MQRVIGWLSECTPMWRIWKTLHRDNASYNDISAGDLDPFDVQNG